MSELVEFYPRKQVAGISGWHWIKTDTGAWDGPVSDWEQCHSVNIERYIKKRGTAIQAGGNLGMYPRLLSYLFKRVFTFEPDPLNFHTMVLNTTCRENIVKFQAAVGAEPGICMINRVTMSNVGMHKVHTDGIDPCLAMIPITTIDSFGFTDVDLIMLDIEGYEYQALLGATSTIAKYKPAIFAERPAQEVDALLKIMGYERVTMSAMDGVYVHVDNLT